MLSYRHGYHAGGPADVLKHAVYAWILADAVRDPAPLYVLDTHAGAGLYDLSSRMARKTGEWQQGIGRLVEQRERPPALFHPFWDIIHDARPSYPGSPVIAQRILRAGDRLELIELHPTDHASLEQGFAGKAEVLVGKGDGVAAMVQRMPPPEKRAVVLIDPSYEIKTEYDEVTAALQRAHRRMGKAVYVLWYPVLSRSAVEPWLERLKRSGIPRQYRLELAMEADYARRGMTASGMVVINPPDGFVEAAEQGLRWLHDRLGARGASNAAWWTEPPGAASEPGAGSAAGSAAGSTPAGATA